MQTPSNSQAGPRKRLDHLSKNGRWRSFPKVPHLLQHVTSGDYSGKTKIHRETIRKSLRTTIWSTVQLRLVDFLKAHRESRERVPSPKFSEAVDRFTREIAADSVLKPKSKEYRLLCLKKIRTTWPELWQLRASEISAPACKDWAARLEGGISSHYW